MVFLLPSDTKIIAEGTSTNQLTFGCPLALNVSFKEVEKSENQNKALQRVRSLKIFTILMEF